MIIYSHKRRIVFNLSHVYMNVCLCQLIDQHVIEVSMRSREKNSIDRLSD